MERRWTRLLRELDRPQLVREQPWLLPVIVFGVASVCAGAVWFAWDEGRIHTPGRTAPWVLTALLIVCATDIRGWARGVLWEWSPLVVIVLAYDLVTARALELANRAHVLPQLRVDEWIFGTVPSVWLQQHLRDPGHINVFDYAAWGLHLSHFMVSVIIAAILWRRSRAQFRLFALSITALTLLGYGTYMLMPAVPPWMASQIGEIEPTVRVTQLVWGHLGFDDIARTLAGGTTMANDVGALPSLHAAYPALALLLLWRTSRPLVRFALAIYPLLMALALVYGAEHFVADVLLGWMYALLVALVAWTVTLRLRV